MRFLLAFLLPPVAVLSCGRPFRAALNVVLTACFWAPGVIHALLVVSERGYDDQTRRTMKKMQGAIAAAHGVDRSELGSGGGMSWLGRVAEVVVLVAAYPLSLGPITWLREHGHLPNFLTAAVDAIYLPLQWLGDAWPAFDQALAQYLLLWR